MKRCFSCENGLLPWFGENGEIVEYIKCDCVALEVMEFDIGTIVGIFKPVAVYESGELCLWTNDAGEEVYVLEEAYPRLEFIFEGGKKLSGIYTGNDHVSFEQDEIALALENAGMTFAALRTHKGLENAITVWVDPKNRQVYQWRAFARDEEGEIVTIKRGEILASVVKSPSALRGFLAGRIEGHFDIFVRDITGTAKDVG
jgi:hypothetical protein